MVTGVSEEQKPPFCAYEELLGVVTRAVAKLNRRAGRKTGKWLAVN